MNITGIGVAVALAVIIAVGFLFLGPAALRYISGTPVAAPTATTTDQTLTANPVTSMETPHTSTASAGAPAPAVLPSPLPTVLTASDEVVGTGATAKSGDTVTVNYVGMLPNGTVFDASASHGQAFSFTLGGGQVIKGWDQGLVGMKEGGKRRLIIPPDLAYGNQAVGGVIPANATLIFDVELVKVQSN